MMPGLRTGKTGAPGPAAGPADSRDRRRGAGTARLAAKVATTVITAAAALLAIPALASASVGAPAQPSVRTVQLTAHAAKAKHPSRVEVSASPRMAVTGARVRLSATIRTSRPAPKGRVIFRAGKRTLCSARVHNWRAHCTTRFPGAGTYGVRGIYTGDAKHRRAVGHVLVRVQHPSRVQVSASPRTAVAGTRVRLSARIRSSRPAPKGRVIFRAGRRTLCSAQVHNWRAHCTTRFPGAGTYAVRGIYTGDAKHRRAVGMTLVRATRAATSTAVSVSTASPKPGQAVTLAAAVTSHSPLAPTGLVRFTAGSSPLCSGRLVNHHAHCTYRWNTAGGTYKVTATYGGDRAHTGSSATSGTITVGKYATTTVITSVTPDTVPAGKSATVTVTVTTMAGAPAATGTATVAPKNTALTGGYVCTATITNGTGTCTITPPVGTFGLIHYNATYSGDATHAASKYTGGFVVTVPDTTTTAVAFTGPATAGKAETVTATVTNQAGNNISPTAGGTGTVTFTIGGTAITGCSAVALSYTKATGNTATCSYTPAAAGTVTVTATYTGDGTNLGSKGSASLTVAK